MHFASTGASQPSAINNEDSDAIQLAAPMVCEVSDSEPKVSEASAINLTATTSPLTKNFDFDGSGCGSKCGQQLVTGVRIFIWGVLL